MFGRSKPVRIAVFGKTDLGRTRDHNEDRFLVADLTRKAASLQPDVRQHDIGPRGTLLVVADGMGGAAAGELASEMATDTIYAHLLKTWNAENEVTPHGSNAATASSRRSAPIRRSRSISRTRRCGAATCWCSAPMGCRAR